MCRDPMLTCLDVTLFQVTAARLWVPQGRGGFSQPVQAKEDVCIYQYYLGKFHRDQLAE